METNSQKDAAQYGLAVSQSSYNTIMANKGTGQAQTWYTYSWLNRTLMDSVKSTISVLEGANHSLVVYDGKVYGWGDVSKKQLTGVAQTPYPVELASVNALISGRLATGVNLTKVFVDRSSNYLTFDDGSVYVWGDNAYNKAGVEGAPVNIDTPTKVTALQDKKVVRVVAGRNTNYYITDDGGIYASGSNVNGVTGLGEGYADEAPIPTPTKIETLGYSETLEPSAAAPADQCTRKSSAQQHDRDGMERGGRRCRLPRLYG